MSTDVIGRTDIKFEEVFPMRLVGDEIFSCFASCPCWREMLSAF